MNKRTTSIQTKKIEEMAARVGRADSSPLLAKELSALVLANGLAITQQIVKAAEERARRIRPRRAA